MATDEARTLLDYKDCSLWPKDQVHAVGNCRVCKVNFLSNILLLHVLCLPNPRLLSPATKFSISLSTFTFVPKSASHRRYGLVMRFAS